MYQTNSEDPNHICTTSYSVMLQIRWTSNIINYITGKYKLQVVFKLTTPSKFGILDPYSSRRMWKYLSRDRR